MHKPLGGPNLYLDLRTRCRKCAACLKFRQYVWAERCVNETVRAWVGGARTWFLTLTFKPSFHVYALGRGGYLDPEVARIANREVTLWFKRLRKAGSSFRYVVVMEPHKSGVPHFHTLFHEIAGCAPVRRSVLRETWSGPNDELTGRIDCELVKERLGEAGRISNYIGKYLTKTKGARVRASASYGAALALPTNGRVLDAPGDGESRSNRQPVQRSSDIEELSCPVM